MVALVISGGGSKGAFAVGAVDYLLNKAQCEFDIYVGTSTGALIAPLALLGDTTKLQDVYTCVPRDKIVSDRNVVSIVDSPSIYSSDPLKELITKVFVTEAYKGSFRYQYILESTKRVIIAAVNFNTGQTEYFYTGSRPFTPLADKSTKVTQITDSDTFVRAILASCCMPVFMPPVAVIDGSDGDRYYDGGCRSILPLQVALEQDATEVYAILNQGKEWDSLSPSAEPYDDIVKIAFRFIDIFCNQIARRDYEYPALYASAANYFHDLKKKIIATQKLNKKDIEEIFGGPNLPLFVSTQPNTYVDLHLIQPLHDHDLPEDDLGFKPKEQLRMYKLGLYTAQEYMAKRTPQQICRVA